MEFGPALKKLWPNGDKKVPGLRAGIIAAAPAVFAEFGVKTPLVLAHIMAQISHECGAGNDVVENLSYTAEGIKKTWPSRFPSVAAATPYARAPQKLANKVYNGRMGNRVGSDDGWNFRGRGGAQTTGRDGYERVSRLTGLPVVENPMLLTHPEAFLRCALADMKGVIPYAKGDDILAVSRVLNVGNASSSVTPVGLASRKAWLAKWKALNVQVPLPAMA